MDKIVDRKFWQDRHLRTANPDRDYSGYRYFGDRVLRRFLAPDPIKTFIEVGCVPGRNMVYFAREFGYRIAGIDYSDAVKEVPACLERHGISSFDVQQADFFTYRTDLRYDVVFSSGFVEHFDAPTDVFRRHCGLLAPGGHLIISMPNLCYGQRLLRLACGVGQQAFATHNLDVMCPAIWGGLAVGEGLEVLYSGYCRTFNFWIPPGSGPYARLVGLAIRSVGVAPVRALGLDQIPNRYLSPQILLVARRPS